MSTPNERFVELRARRISIVHDMPALLSGLEPFLKGELADDWLAEATDEQVYATLLGWHLRAIQVARPSEALKMAVFTELERRRMACDPSVDPNTAERMAKRRNKGGLMAAGQMLIRDEIEGDELERLWRRIHRVHRTLTRKNGEAPEMAAMRSARWLTDEEILDLFLWFGLTSPEGDGLLVELGAEPEAALDYVREVAYQARVAQAIAEGDIFEGEESMMGWRMPRVTAEDRAGLKRLHALEASYIPPLNSEVEMYRRRNGLAFDDAFWTDDRIAGFIALDNALDSDCDHGENTAGQPDENPKD